MAELSERETELFLREFRTARSLQQMRDIAGRWNITTVQQVRQILDRLPPVGPQPPSERLPLIDVTRTRTKVVPTPTLAKTRPRPGVPRLPELLPAAEQVPPVSRQPSPPPPQEAAGEEPIEEEEAREMEPSNIPLPSVTTLEEVKEEAYQRGFQQSLAEQEEAGVPYQEAYEEAVARAVRYANAFDKVLDRNWNKLRDLSFDEIFKYWPGVVTTYEEMGKELEAGSEVDQDDVVDIVSALIDRT